MDKNKDFEVSYTREEGVVIDGHSIPHDIVVRALFAAPACVLWDGNRLSFGDSGTAYLLVSGFHYEFPGRMINKYGRYYL